MKSSVLLTIYTLFACPSTAWKAFCPVRSPSRQYVYFTDEPSWSKTSMLQTQCSMECMFCSSKKSCTDCRAFNYNSTSLNCSIFSFDPQTFGFDPQATTIGYRENTLPVPGFWSTVSATLCNIIFDGTTYTRFSHVFDADQYCGVDHYYCKLPNGTEKFCIPGNTSANLGTNVALNASALQTSTWSTSIATYAVDGSLGTMACTRAPSNSQSWWAVNLGNPRRINVVQVFGDANPSFSYRLDNFHVWLSNTRPEVNTALNTTTCTLCLQYSGRVSENIPVIMNCPVSLAAFQYVIIQSSLVYSAICLYEVRVFTY